MSLKDDFLKIETYDEFDKNRNKFRNLKFDQDVIDHFDKIFGKGYVGGDIKHGLIEELHKN